VTLRGWCPLSQCELVGWLVRGPRTSQKFLQVGGVHRLRHGSVKAGLYRGYLVRVRCIVSMKARDGATPKVEVGSGTRVQRPAVTIRVTAATAGLRVRACERPLTRKLGVTRSLGQDQRMSESRCKSGHPRNCRLGLRNCRFRKVRIRVIHRGDSNPSIANESGNARRTSPAPC